MYVWRRGKGYVGFEKKQQEKSMKMPIAVDTPGFSPVLIKFNTKGILTVWQ